MTDDESHVLEHFIGNTSVLLHKLQENLSQLDALLSGISWYHQTKNKLEENKNVSK
jgi:hypothetical protein